MSGQISNVELLGILVRRHVAGTALPSHIGSGEFAVPLDSWLAGLSTNRDEAPMQIAMLLDHTAERPLVSEVASTLAARLAEAERRKPAPEPIAPTPEPVVHTIRERIVDVADQPDA